VLEELRVLPLSVSTPLGWWVFCYECQALCVLCMC
jgi:hypothetical protein